MYIKFHRNFGRKISISTTSTTGIYVRPGLYFTPFYANKLMNKTCSYFYKEKIEKYFLLYDETHPW